MAKQMQLQDGGVGGALHQGGTMSEPGRLGRSRSSQGAWPNVIVPNQNSGIHSKAASNRRTQTRTVMPTTGSSQYSRGTR